MKSNNLLSLLFILTAFVIVFPSHLQAQDTSPALQNRQSSIGDLEVVETESGIYYTVKKGDTLWIPRSRTLTGSKLPHKVISGPTASRASASGTIQSTSMISAPEVAMCLVR